MGFTAPNLCQIATDRSPDIRFDALTPRLSIRGSSYPEDVAAFYGPVLADLKQVLGGMMRAGLTVDIALVYFNSSSAKALMNLFLLLEGAAEAGNDIIVNWFHTPDDDTMREFGEEFAEDVRFIRFNVIPATPET